MKSDMDMFKDSEEKQHDVDVKGNNDVKGNKEEEKVDDSDCVVPVTPDDVRENGDSDMQFQSPLTLSVVRKQLNQACIGSPRTPKDVVFDPFGEEDDDMEQRAPHSNKYLDDFSRNTVARQLNFQAFHHADQFLSDEDIFVSFYQSLLQFVITMQTEERFLSHFSITEYADDDFKTPAITMLPFKGIADDTCPGSPLRLKPACQPRIIPVGLCKKLEF